LKGRWRTGPATDADASALGAVGSFILASRLDWHKETMMKLMSQSFKHGAAFPGEFAFAVMDPKTHISLAQTEIRISCGKRTQRNQILRAHLP
jgi:hypothetical protein